MREKSRTEQVTCFGRAEAWRELLESAGRAVLGLDRCGRVLAVSPAAEALVRGDLQLRNGRLTVGDGALQARLCRLIQAAIRCDPSDSDLMPPPVGIRQASGRMLHVDALPLPPDVTPPRRIVALLFLREADHAGTSLSGALRERFGLTPAEARLAVVLADGIGLREAAERSGIRLSTARVQLKSIFAKTETHRQGELVALLARFG